mmetsp:Transcript_21754/g.55462  ORF Transcript_21754/g.55462 Transcript_21754/m.55462 type:complete len:235 (-) Transcript_21754:120-824(-)
MACRRIANVGPPIAPVAAPRLRVAGLGGGLLAGIPLLQLAAQQQQQPRTTEAAGSGGGAAGATSTGDGRRAGNLLGLPARHLLVVRGLRRPLGSGLQEQEACVQARQHLHLHVEWAHAPRSAVGAEEALAAHHPARRLSRQRRRLPIAGLISLRDRNLRVGGVRDRGHRRHGVAPDGCSPLGLPWHAPLQTWGQRTGGQRTCGQRPHGQRHSGRLRSGRCSAAVLRRPVVVARA